MTEHTPGPWEIRLDDQRERVEIVGNNGLVICVMVAESEAAGKRVCSNARLIAAAPDMLKALIRLELLARDLLLHIDGGTAERSGRLPREILAARNALKKARGEE